jgi:hypothetical protein
VAKEKTGACIFSLAAEPLALVGPSPECSAASQRNRVVSGEKWLMPLDRIGCERAVVIRPGGNLPRPGLPSGGNRKRGNTLPRDEAKTGRSSGRAQACAVINQARRAAVISP